MHGQNPIKHLFIIALVFPFNLLAIFSPKNCLRTPTSASFTATFLTKHKTALQWYLPKTSKDFFYQKSERRYSHNPGPKAGWIPPRNKHDHKFKKNAL